VDTTPGGQRCEGPQPYLSRQKTVAKQYTIGIHIVEWRDADQEIDYLNLKGIETLGGPPFLLFIFLFAVSLRRISFEFG
jgi:hypothetical protein